MFILIKALVIGLALFFSCIAESAQNKHIDPSTGITSWEINSQGVNFSLTQILPEQAKAFYVNRGFTLKQTESFASSCVYMTIMRNDTAPDTIHFVKSNWSIVSNNKSYPPVPVASRLKKLKDINVNKAALNAFRRAQFPGRRGRTGAGPGGDWNQGMLSVGLPANSLFDLIVRWDINGKEYETTLVGVQCAK